MYWLVIIFILASIGFMIKKNYMFNNEESLICVSLVSLYMILILYLNSTIHLILFNEIKKIHLFFKGVFIINVCIAIAMQIVMRKCKTFFICVSIPFVRIAEYIKRWNILEEHNIFDLLLPIEYGNFNAESEIWLTETGSIDSDEDEIDDIKGEDVSAKTKMSLGGKESDAWLNQALIGKKIIGY